MKSNTIITLPIQSPDPRIPHVRALHPQFHRLTPIQARGWSQIQAGGRRQRQTCQMEGVSVGPIGTWVALSEYFVLSGIPAWWMNFIPFVAICFGFFDCTPLVWISLRTQFPAAFFMSASWLFHARLTFLLHLWPGILHYSLVCSFNVYDVRLEFSCRLDPFCNSEKTLVQCSHIKWMALNTDLTSTSYPQSINGNFPLVSQLRHFTPVLELRQIASPKIAIVNMLKC